MKKEKGYFTEKKPWQRIIVLVAGALMNYVLAVFLIIVCFFAYGQTMGFGRSVKLLAERFGQVFPFLFPLVQSVLSCKRAKTAEVYPFRKSRKLLRTH